MNKATGRKKFFTYFWNTFRESKLLLLKYIIVAVLMSVISILSNLLNVKNLTYLNAFLSLYAFASIIAFGISNGISIFMNQNIGSKFKVRKYAKVGFEINIIFSFFATILLLTCSKFFMETFCISISFAVQSSPQIIHSLSLPVRISGLIEKCGR